MNKDTPLANEKIDGENDLQGDLGKLSKVTRAKRTPEPVAGIDPGMREAATAEVLARSLSTDLHARDKKGRPIPTLAERIRKEGFRAQLRGRDKTPAPKSKAASRKKRR